MKSIRQSQNTGAFTSTLGSYRLGRDNEGGGSHYG